MVHGLPGPHRDLSFLSFVTALFLCHCPPSFLSQAFPFPDEEPAAPGRAALVLFSPRVAGLGVSEPLPFRDPGAPGEPAGPGNKD